MHELDGASKMFAATMLKIHRMVASEIDDTKNHSEKTNELYFPGDIACNADSCNYGGGRSSRSGKLKNYCHMMETVVSKNENGMDMFQLFAFEVWKVVTNGLICSLAVHHQINSDNDYYIEAKQHMSNMSRGMS